MSISLASVFICENNDPNCVRGYRAMRARGYNKSVVHVWKKSQCLYSMWLKW